MQLAGIIAMQNNTKIISLVVLGMAVFALTTVVDPSTSQQAKAYGSEQITEIKPVAAGRPDDHSHIDDQYEVFVKPAPKGYAVHQPKGYISHGFENALRRTMYHKDH
jgi:hypothetical protein